MSKPKLFLASSSELKEDREQFEIFINRKNKDWIQKGVFIELIVWEDFLDALSKNRLQDEYNQAIRECDLFVMLFCTKVGRYTEEEFETAFGQFQATNKPFIFTYFKDADISTASANKKDLMSLWAFQEKLVGLGHFYTVYKTIDELKFKFNSQLDKLVANGFIEFNPDHDDADRSGGTRNQATLGNNGTVVQGSGTAIGKGGVHIGGNNSGDINTGARIDTGVNVSNKNIATHGGTAVEGSVKVSNGHFIGRDYLQTITHVIQAGEDLEEARSVIALYLDALVKDLAGLKLAEIDSSTNRSRHNPLQLADIYVPLDTTLRIPENTALADWLRLERKRRYGEFEPDRETKPVPALAALAAHRELIVLGNAGSGKSTFGASVLLALAQIWQGHRDEIRNFGEAWTHGAPLPVRVVLRRFSEQLPAGNEPARAGDLWAFIARDLKVSGYGLSSETMKYVQRIARVEGALIFLDGLDECGDSTSRERITAPIDELMRSAGSKCRFVLTARPYAWPGGPDPNQGVYALADLNDEQVEQFIRAWYAALVKREWLSPGEAARKLEDLLNARHRPDLLPLAKNPLLLTLMATLHTNEGRLPDDRADLYNDSIDLLMLRWNRQIGADKALLDELAIPGLKLSDLREVLEELAFNVHEQNAGRNDMADIGEDRLVRAIRPLLNNSRDKAIVVVDYIEKRAGLLIGQGEKDGERRFTFPHRTIQEFLAACHLAARGDFPPECARLAQTAPMHWQVTLALAARLAKAERGASAADELIGGVSIEDIRRTGRNPNQSEWTCAWLAGTQLQEIGMGAIKKTDRTRAISMRVAGWLAASLPVHPDEGGMPAKMRAQAGDILAILGDPRFDPQRYYLPVGGELGFVYIAADPQFKIGTRLADFARVAKIVDYEVSDEEINDEPTPTNEFFIARYPVTVAQFKVFVDETGFPIENPDALGGPDSRPVHFVSWREALAYCDWLNEVLKTSTDLPSTEISARVRSGKWRLSLPSELEWEKAARGNHPDSLFPWGDEADPNRANNRESQIGDSSVVGCFPPNDLGLYDLIGNVWEWTRSLWGKDLLFPEFKYPYLTDDSMRENLKAPDNVYRVVRGASWYDRRDLARCACRSGGRPGGRDGNLGFRVVLRCAPVS